MLSRDRTPPMLTPRKIAVVTRRGRRLGGCPPQSVCSYATASCHGKFPSTSDEFNAVIWEAVALTLAGPWPLVCISSRGLAHGLKSRTEYKQMMDLADSPRQGDLDGRGNLSQRALIEFVVWFLQVAVDQARFMTGLFDLGNLTERLHTWVREKMLKPESARLLDEIVIRGEIQRGEVSRITGLPERTARRILNDLVKEGVAASTTPKGPVSLRFPINSLETLFPRLYPHT